MADIVKVIKLTSGEHIIAKIISENDHTVRLKKPASVFMQEVVDKKGIPTGKMEVHLSPFAPFSQKDEIDLERGSIQYMSAANANIASQYLQVTTGLAIPENPSLILS